MSQLSMLPTAVTVAMFAQVPHPVPVVSQAAARADASARPRSYSTGAAGQVQTHHNTTSWKLKRAYMQVIICVVLWCRVRMVKLHSCSRVRSPATLF